MKTMSKVFKDLFSNLAKSFLDKPPDPSNNPRIRISLLLEFYYPRVVSH